MPGDSGRHPRGAPCGQPRREEAGDGEQHYCDEKDSRIRGTNAKGERCKPTPEHQRSDCPAQQPCSQDDARLTQYRELYPCGGRAERDPEPDLLCALAHAVRKHTVEANCREQQRHSCEGCHQDKREPFAPDSSTNNLCHRSSPVHDQFWVHTGDRGPHVGENPLWWKIGCDHV